MSSQLNLDIEVAVAKDIIVRPVPIKPVKTSKEELVYAACFTYVPCRSIAVKRDVFAGATARPDCYKLTNYRRTR